MGSLIEIRNVHKIVDILFEDPVLAQNVEQFFDSLELQPAILHDIKSKCSGTPGILREILHQWISKRGSEATFEKLAHCLRNKDFVNVADKLTTFVRLESTEFDSKLDGTDPSTKLSFEIPRPTLHFVGREAELLSLDETIMNGKRAGTVVSGMGGIGKTTLAIQYSWKCQSGSFPNVIWINAENSSTMSSTFGRLAKELNIDGTKSDAVEQVYKKLDDSKSLFIFDNAESYVDIESYLPNSVFNSIILITSRNGEWAEEFKIIELKLFTEEESIELMKKYVKLENDEELNTAKELCKTLKYHPIAISQAGSTIKDTDAVSHETMEVTMKQYLKQFDADSKKLLDFQYGRENDEENELTTFITWHIAMDKINSRNNVCKRILQFIAYLSPHRIPIKVLRHIKHEKPSVSKQLGSSLCCISPGDRNENLQEELLKSGIDTLCGYSIIMKNCDYNYISVHPLVQKVIRWHYGKKEKRLLLRAVKVFEGAKHFEELDNLESIKSLWEYALEHNGIVKRFPDFGVMVCHRLSVNHGSNDDKLKFCKKTIEKFKSLITEVVWQLPVMCTEIFLLSDIRLISELVSIVAKHFKEFIDAKNDYSKNFFVAEQSLRSKVEGEEVLDYWKLTTKFYRIHLDVAKSRRDWFDSNAILFVHSDFVETSINLMKR